MRRPTLREILLYVIIALLYAILDRSATSAPFLVYNPTPAVAAYELQIDGQSAITIEPTSLPDGTVRLVYDLVDLAPGRHIFKARAQYEVWGWIPWSDDFLIIKPEEMQGPEIVQTP